MLALVDDDGGGTIPAGVVRYLITAVLRRNGGSITKMNLFVHQGTIWERQTVRRNKTAQSGSKLIQWKNNNKTQGIKSVYRRHDISRSPSEDLQLYNARRPMQRQLMEMLQNMGIYTDIQYL